MSEGEGTRDDGEPPGSDPVAELRAAAAKGDIARTLEILYGGGFLDGLVHYLEGRWGFLRNDRHDSHLIVSEAVEVLYRQLNDGNKVIEPRAFLFKVAHRIAYKQQKALETRERAEREHGADPVQGGGEDDEAERTRKRGEALRVARSLLPRLGLQNARRVLEYLFECIEKGRVDVSYPEIADALGLSPEAVRKACERGFSRLARIVREEGLRPPELLEEEEGVVLGGYHDEEV